MGLFNRASKTSTDSETEAAKAPQLGAKPAVDNAGRRAMDDHRDYLLSMVEPLAPFGMGLAEAWGRTLCEDIKSYTDLPPVAVAEVDGYAFGYRDVMGTRELTVAQAPAGDADGAGDGQAVATEDDDRAIPVRAGDQMPAGTDTVVANWQVQVHDNDRRVSVLTRVAEGDWVRPARVEAHDGQMLMTAGTLLDDRRSALLAAAGFERVLVRPRTRVALAHVIDSKRQPDLNGGRSDSVGIHLINGATKSDGASVVRVDIDLATPEESRERLNDELIRCDLVFTIGGLTDDDVDSRLTDLLESMGVVDVATVALRPGGRHGFGLIGDEHTPVIMLPDDPTAMLVAYHAFARPVLRKMMGAEPFAHEAVLCFAERDFDAELGLTQFVPCRLRQDGNRYVASEITSRRHSWLTTLTASDALVMLVGNRRRVYSGEAMPCWLLGDQLVTSE